MDKAAHSEILDCWSGTAIAHTLNEQEMQS